MHFKSLLFTDDTLKKVSRGFKEHPTYPTILPIWGKWYQGFIFLTIA